MKMENIQDKNQREKSDGTTIKSSSDHENRKIGNEETSKQIDDEKLIINSETARLLHSKMVLHFGSKAVSGLKPKFSRPWKDNILKNESAANKLLTSLARILLERSHLSCACIKWEQEKIRIAFNGKRKISYDEDGKRKKTYDEKTSEVIRQLAVETSNLEQWIEQWNSAKERKQRKKGNRSFTRDFTRDFPTADNIQGIAKIKECKQKLVKSAVFKDRDLFSGLRESEAWKQLVSKLFIPGEKIQQSLENFEEVVINFCESCRRKDPTDENIKALLAKYSEYCTSLRTVHRKKLASGKSSSSTDVSVRSTIHKALFLPFLNLYDTISLFEHLLRNSREWKKIRTAIIDQGFEVVLAEEQKHAEMKMLEANHFNIEIFTTGSSKAMITRSPCVNCWMLLCACTEDEKVREKITEKFGGSGFLYINWTTPGAKDVDPERKEQIESSYLSLVERYAEKMKVKRDYLEIGTERNLDNGVEELTSIREVIDDKNSELRQGLVLVDKFEEKAFWNQR